MQGDYGKNMDLKAFYLNNITDAEYHHRFYKAITDINQVFTIFDDWQEIDDCKFEVFDAEEAIAMFRELCQPEIQYFDNEKKCWFYLTTYYLSKMGYEIKEFPRVLARPPEDPSDFTYKQIRNRIIEEGKDDEGTVRYAARRVFVANLTFEQKANHIEIENAIEQKFIEISNRNASFDNMSTGEKLAEIANLIEHLLKKNGNFNSPDFSEICFDYITGDAVAKYRKQLQCFRHSNKEAITERSQFSERQKIFLVDYGLIMIKAIHELHYKA